MFSEAACFPPLSCPRFAPPAGLLFFWGGGEFPFADPWQPRIKPFRPVKEATGLHYRSIRQTLQRVWSGDTIDSPMTPSSPKSPQAVPQTIAKIGMMAHGESVVTAPTGRCLSSRVLSYFLARMLRGGLTKSYK